MTTKIRVYDLIERVLENFEAGDYERASVLSQIAIAVSLDHIDSLLVNIDLNFEQIVSEEHGAVRTVAGDE